MKLSKVECLSAVAQNWSPVHVTFTTILLAMVQVCRSQINVVTSPHSRPAPGQPHRSASSESEFIDRLLHYYNKQTPPLKDRPTKVQLGIYINSFYSISEQTMDYSVSMYLRQVWRDPRLAFPQLNPKTMQVRLGEESLNQVWTPDTFFRNEKRASFHEVTVNNRLMRLNVTGHIWYVTKISATLSCPMKLQTFPLDTQICPMMFESFGYTMDTLYFSWMSDRPVDVDKNVQLPQFILQGYILNDCSQNYTAGINAALPKVSYVKAVDVWMSVCLVLVFAGLIEYATVNVLSRQSRPVPPARRHHQPAGSRLAPTSTAASAASAKSLPSINQQTSAPPSGDLTGRRFSQLQAGVKLNIEARLGQVGVVAGLTRKLGADDGGSQPEVAAAGDGRPSTLPVIGMRGRGMGIAEPGANGGGGGGGGAGAGAVTDGKYRARKVDKISRAIFPAAFILFNIVYWSIYTSPDRSLYDVNELIDI